MTEQRRISGGRSNVTIEVHETVELDGILQANVAVDGRFTIASNSVVQGNLHVAGGASVTIAGTMQGNLNIDRDGKVTVADGGTLAGNVNNRGTILLEGRMTRSSEDLGDVVLLPGGDWIEPKVEEGPDGVVRRRFQI